MTRFRIAVIGAAVLVASIGLLAHENFRIVGTVTRISAGTLVVTQSRDGVVVTMRMNRQTVVTRDKKTVDRAELKSGSHVIVEARGDSLKDLLVHAVRLVPPPSR